MEFEQRIKQKMNGEKSSGRAKNEIEEDRKVPLKVNFYSIPPFGNVDLEYAESVIEERLNILRVFAESKTSSYSVSCFEDYSSAVKNKLKSMKNAEGKDNFYTGSISPLRADFEPSLRKDHVSHFLLRIYFCQTEELKKKFIAMECEFLRFRLYNCGSNEIVRFITENNLLFQIVNSDEIARVNTEVSDEYFQNQFKDRPVYKLPFEEALELVRLRKAYLRGGIAYIQTFDMISIIVEKFRLELSRSLADLCLHLAELDEERRLIPLIDHFHKLTFSKKTANESSSSGYRVTSDMLDDLSKESFPPCMRNIHETLRANHHLKHYGRLHYGLFLKSIGLSLEDALDFFREEFIQKVTPERFQRDYSYNIRYNYGKEGKKVNLSAYSCAKIIGGCPPQSGDTHGCPFRHFDAENLKNFLKRCGANDEQVDEMLKNVKEKTYNKACALFFEMKHNQPFNEEMYHPNQYYKESRKLQSTVEGPFTL